jgi:alkanesulfonate monooxygenase SsuD/methylene tetrahydromethanopterin reductase-like flavin-dependent oxidoreductase (luciferase family)/iron-sulfur cluster repair protein YtfE (RIC family)
MSDYGHDLLFGSFINPHVQHPQQAVQLARICEQAGLDLVTFQDHPYQPGLLDAWTLLSYVAAATERIRLATNVLNLPLRRPIVIARSAASLDLLSGGRVELGIGTGAFWDAIEANGGQRLTAGQSVNALREAIEIIRAVWAVGEAGSVRVEGEHHRIPGAERGPAPAHPIGIWVGAYKPRLLRLTGAVGDGCIPTLDYLPGGVADLAEMNRLIDDGAANNGREPAAVKRLLNFSGQFATTSRSFADGPPAQWIDQLAELAIDDGISGFILLSDDAAILTRYAEEVVPAVRELVASERARVAETARPDGSVSHPLGSTAGQDEAAPGELTERRADQRRTESDSADHAGTTVFATTPTPAPDTRLTDRKLWDESARPVAPPSPSGHIYTPQAQAVGRHLVDVHDGLRQELAEIRELIQQVRQGRVSAAAARSAINQTTLRQNDWTLGAYCASYCRIVTEHHSGEDQAIFPHLRRADSGLVPVIDRLQEEHNVIHEVLDAVDRALVGFVEEPDDFSGLQQAVDTLTDALLSHLSYEEQQIIEPIARYGFYAGQVHD